MRTLFLYADYDGNPRAAIVQHSEDFDTCSDGNILAVQEAAQGYNDGCTFFFVELPDIEGFRPDITADEGDEVPVQFITM